MFKPNVLKTPLVASVEAIASIASPQLSSIDNSVPVILYSKSLEPIGKVNVVVPADGLYGILYLDKIYLLRNSIYVETDIIKAFPS